MYIVYTIIAIIIIIIAIYFGLIINRIKTYIIKFTECETLIKQNILTVLPSDSGLNLNDLENKYNDIENSNDVVKQSVNILREYYNTTVDEYNLFLSKHKTLKLFKYRIKDKYFIPNQIKLEILKN